MKFIINGGKRLVGELSVQGSKNSVLPILAATVLVKGKSVIHNCPLLRMLMPQSIFWSISAVKR